MKKLKIASVIMLISLVVSLVGCTSKEEKRRQEQQKIRAAYEAEYDEWLDKFEQAIEKKDRQLVRKILEAKPSSPEGVTSSFGQQMRYTELYDKAGPLVLPDEAYETYSLLMEGYRRSH